MYGYIPPPEEPPKKPELMSACIERKHGTTFCNRCPPSSEFTFASSAAKHIIDHYDPRTMRRGVALRLSGCIACIDNAKEIIAREGLSRLA